jgi:hypothetical protein
MTPWVYVLLVIGLLLVLLVILQVAGVQWPSTDASDYTTDPITDPAPPTPTSAPADAPERIVAEPRYIYKGLVREQAVCKTLEDLYNRGFPTVRPSWLLNPATGQPLEYDCYNADLKIAAEHNGEHHYVFPNKYHKTDQEFLAQRARDEHKRRLSDEHGVYLLTVPYWVPAETIKDWVEYYCPERVAQRARIERLSPPVK